VRVKSPATTRRPLLGRHGDLQGRTFWGVGVGHNARNNELGQKSLTNNVIGASVDIGPGTLYGQYATIKDEKPTGLSGVSASLIGRQRLLTPVAPIIPGRPTTKA
jgi:hypothetical protein